MSDSFIFGDQKPLIDLREVKKNFAFRKSVDGSPESYHGIDIYTDHRDFCDIYFVSQAGEVTKEQVDIFNRFNEKLDGYMEEAQSAFASILSAGERRSATKIKDAPLTFELIEIPFWEKNYDLCWVCSKSYKILRWFQRKIVLKFEIKNDKIIGAGRIKEVQHITPED